jgi:hypothetical protein
MKIKQFLLPSLTTLALLLCGFVFLNLNTISKVPVFEKGYPGNGIPLSQIVADSQTQLTREGRVEILAGEIAYIDQSIDVGELVINGELYCDNMTKGMPPIEIKARVIYVNGHFECGTAAVPYTGELTISLKHGSDDPRTNPAYRGLIINNEGTLVLNGKSGKAGWVKLNATTEPKSAQTVITVDQVVNGTTSSRKWEVGDEIVIAPTSFQSSDAEKFTITAINGTQISLNGTIQKVHWGQIQNLNIPAITKGGFPKVLDQRAEVANLSRNILIRADESVTPISNGPEVGAELGGHVMVMPGGAAQVNAVEFYRMGQAGMMGRYPFHWHWVGDAYGQHIKNSSIHRSFQRCITVHRTNYAVVDNNTCFDFKGHGYFLEDGTERKNLISNNIGIHAKYPHREKRLLDSDITATGNALHGEAQGRFPNVSVFWMSHPDNDVRGNVAAGSVGTGYWMGFHNQTEDNGVILYPSVTNTLYFGNNIAHSNLVGFTWDGGPNGNLMGNPNNPEDRKVVATPYKPSIVPVFKNLTAFKNAYTGIYYRGKGIFENALTADNGFHYWLSEDQIVRYSVIVGRSQNFSSADQTLLNTNLGRNYLEIPTRRQRQAGIALYDGPFDLNNIYFLDFPTQQINTTINGGVVDVTPTVVGLAGGTESMVNLTKNVVFNPNPLYRAYMPEICLGCFFKDTDGSFINGAFSPNPFTSGGFVVGKKSLGYLPSQQCVDGGITFKNMVVCPATYTESTFNIFDGHYTYINSQNQITQVNAAAFHSLNGNVDTSGLWGHAFVVRRSDGAVSNNLNEWPGIFGYSALQTLGNGTKFNMANSSQYDYELLLRTRNAAVWVNSPIPNPIMPVVKIVAHGKNCRLQIEYPNNGDADVPAVEKFNLQDLRNSTSNSFFSDDENLYVKIYPHTSVYPGTPAANSAFTSEHYLVVCDPPQGYEWNINSRPVSDVWPVDRVVKGKIESIQYTGSQASPSIIVKGYACHLNRNKKINVRLSLKNNNSDTNEIIVGNDITAQLASDENVAFKCGIPGSHSSLLANIPHVIDPLSGAQLHPPIDNGFRFEFTIPSTVVLQNPNKKIYVKGLSDIAQFPSVYLEQSGVYGTSTSTGVQTNK